MKLRWLIVGLLILAIVAGVIWYWLKLRPKPVQTTEEAIEALTEVPTAIEKLGTQSNPVEGKLPEVNPVERVNPFKYRNPFD